MVDEERKPWEQQSGEPDAAYIRFQFYRNLGPCRTLTKAFVAAMESVGEDPKSVKRRRVPGLWHDDCRVYHWVNRVHKWDIHTLDEAGEKTVAALGHYMQAFLIQSYEALAKSKPAKTHKDHLEIINAFSVLIAPDAVKGLLDRHRGGTVGSGTNGEIQDRPGSVCAGEAGSRADAGPAADSTGDSDGTVPG